MGVSDEKPSKRSTIIPPESPRLLPKMVSTTILKLPEPLESKYQTKQKEMLQPSKPSTNLPDASEDKPSKMDDKPLAIPTILSENSTKLPDQLDEPNKPFRFILPTNNSAVK